jgi:hypothetical protein
MPVPCYGRGWTAIQVREGDNLSCRNARISENTIVSLPLIHVLRPERLYPGLPV